MRVHYNKDGLKKAIKHVLVQQEGNKPETSVSTLYKICLKVMFKAILEREPYVDAFNIRIVTNIHTDDDMAFVDFYALFEGEYKGMMELDV